MRQRRSLASNTSTAYKLTSRRRLGQRDSRNESDRTSNTSCDSTQRSAKRRSWSMVIQLSEHALVFRPKLSVRGQMCGRRRSAPDQWEGQGSTVPGQNAESIPANECHFFLSFNEIPGFYRILGRGKRCGNGSGGWVGVQASKTIRPSGVGCLARTRNPWWGGRVGVGSRACVSALESDRARGSASPPWKGGRPRASRSVQEK